MVELISKACEWAVKTFTGIGVISVVGIISLLLLREGKDDD